MAKNPYLNKLLLEEEELISNTENRTPVIFCLDCSFSMRQQRRLERVMEGMKEFCRDMAKDPVAGLSVEVCIVSFGGEEPKLDMDFTPPNRVILPPLKADGRTPLTKGIRLALDTLESRKVRYDQNGITIYRPWLIIIGDGDDTGSKRDLDQMAAVLKAESDAKHLNVLCITVGDENQICCSSLMKLSPNGKVQYLKDLKFREFFAWLSRSMEKTSRSMGHEEPLYEPTVTWAELLERRKPQ
jgi:uncharacterized protein YegL